MAHEAFGHTQLLCTVQVYSRALTHESTQSTYIDLPLFKAVFVSRECDIVSTIVDQCPQTKCLGRYLLLVRYMFLSRFYGLTFQVLACCGEDEMGRRLNCTVKRTPNFSLPYKNYSRVPGAVRLGFHE